MFRKQQIRNRWHDKTKLERTLVICVTISAIIITALVFVLIFKHTYSWSDECRTPVCLAEASRILSQIDTNQNACQNFFSFTCNTDANFFNRPRNLLEEEAYWIEMLYKQASREDDLPHLTNQRDLYKSCTNKTSILRDSYKATNSILASLGGWPVVQGQFWKEGHFDWLGMSYKLRQIGFSHEIFLGLQVVRDYHTDDQYIFQVVVPKIEQISSSIFDDRDPTGFLTDIAIAFGAETHKALAEMSDVYQLVQDLKWLQSRFATQDDRNIPRRATIAQFQHEYGVINWLQFISKISGHAVKVTEKDYVLFPSEAILDDWFELLLKTPKRTLANYMFWRIIDQLLPYLSEEMQKRGVKPKLTEDVQTRSEFCIQEVEKRFVPSPIRLTYVKKIVTEENKRQLGDFVRSLKYELIKVMKRMYWQEETYKQTAVDAVYDLEVIVGMPDNYFEPDLFYELLTDSKMTKENFVNMLAQANKNHYTNYYNLITKPVRNSTFWIKYQNIPTILNNRHELSLQIPSCLLQRDIFDSQQATSINYANMGLALGPALLQILRLPLLEFEDALLMENWARQVECTSNSRNLNKNMTDKLLGYLLGVKLAYAAYLDDAQKFQEQTLIDVNYTGSQLFWIIAAQQMCSQTFFLTHEDEHKVRVLLQDILSKDEQLLSDFSCPISNVNQGCSLQ